MKKIKYLIICLIIAILIIILIIFGLKNNSEKNTTYNNDEVEKDAEIDAGISTEETLNECSQETQEYEYLDNIDNLKNLFEYITKSNNSQLYAILDSKYKKENNINEQNCSSKFTNYKNIESFYIKEMYTQKVAYYQDTLKEINYIKILIRIDGKENNLYVIVRKDFETQAYSIDIINEEQYNNYINGKEKIEKNYNIELNEYNEIKYSDTYQGKICLIMYDDYINSIKNNVENSYYLLDKEYREKRFLDINEYKEYINTNKEKLFNMTITQFIKDEQDEYTEYICMDNSNNYLIFRVTDGINYTLLLDEYTVDINNAVEKYNKSDIQKKVALNINKFITAINDKNYNYSYSILADSFKQNKYPNINEFKKYIQNNFYEENTVTYNEFTQQGSNYVYKITLKDKNSGSFKDVTIVMKLKEDTKFEMSFSIN